jgi:ATP-binding cassette subfamily B protein
MNIKTLKRLLVFAKPYLKYLYAALFFSALNIVFTLLTPILIGQGVDLLISGNVNFDLLKLRIAYIFITVLLASLFQWLLVRMTNTLTYNITKDLRNKLFKQYTSLSLKYIDSSSQGDLMTRMINDIDLIGDGLLQGFTSLFSGIMTILGTIGFMIYISLPIACIVIILTPLSLLVASIIASKTYKYFQQQLSLRGDLAGYVNEMIGHQTIVKAFSYEDDNIEQFKQLNQKVHVSGVKSQFFGALVNPSTRVVNNIVYAAVCIFGALQVVSGNFSVGALSSFLTYANQYTKPFNEISNVFTELQTALACAARVFNVLDEQTIVEVDQPQTIEKVEGNIDIENVYFSYTQNPLIENFSLNVKSGETIAIVGPTGCGKTTFINLLMRFYDPIKGSIKIDGVDCKNMHRDYLRSLYGMVLQDTWLFSGTIKENIAYGKVDASDEEIIEAAKNAHAHKFIMQLKDGYDTYISEDGGNLSQGQKQLLCIARIMLVKPPMLILDEATSSIDTRTEKQIQDAFDVMMKGRTTFIVAHRLSTIKKADKIIVMNQGKIIESGNHNELLKNKGFYHHLYYSQFDVN